MLCTRPDCDRPAPAGLYLCGGCVERLARILGRAVSLVLTARETVAKQGGNQGGAGSGGVSAAPVNLEASERLGVFEALLARHRVDVPEGPVVRARRVARTSLSGPWLADLEHAEARLVEVVDRAPDWRVLGPCGMVRPDGTPCTGHYRYEHGQQVAVCSRWDCGATMDVAQYRGWQMRTASAELRAASDVPGPLTSKVRALKARGVPLNEATVRSWVQRGHLTPHEVTATGRRVYTAAAILDIWEAQAEVARTKRHASA